MKASISTKGFEKYLEAVAAAGKDVDQSAAKAVKIGAEIIQEGMQELVPILTGNLHDHIQIDGPNQDGNYISADVGLIQKKSFTDAETARYGMAVEYGTSKMEAQPFIRPGYDQNKNKARKGVRESLKKDGTL